MLASHLRGLAVDVLNEVLLAGRHRSEHWTRNEGGVHRTRKSGLELRLTELVPEAMRWHDGILGDGQPIHY